MTYRHKQLGFVTISAFAIAFLIVIDLLVLAIMFWKDGTPLWVILLLALAALLMIVCGFLFSSLTITVSKGRLEWYFGPGFLKKCLPVDEISTIMVTRSKWWQGWGVRRIRGGRLYSVSGLRALELQLSDGQHIRLGSDEPEKLAAALEKARSEKRPGVRTTTKGKT